MLLDILKDFVKDTAKGVKEAATAIGAGLTLDTSSPEKAMENAKKAILWHYSNAERLNKAQEKIAPKEPTKKGVFYKEKQLYRPLSLALGIPDAPPELTKNLNTIQILYDRLYVLKKEQEESKKKPEGREKRILATEHVLNAYIESCKDLPTFSKPVNLIDVYNEAKLKANKSGMSDKDFLEGTLLKSSSTWGKMGMMLSEFHTMLIAIAEIHGINFQDLEKKIQQVQDRINDDIRNPEKKKPGQGVK